MAVVGCVRRVERFGTVNMTNPRYTLLMHNGATCPLFVELAPDEWLHVDNQPQVYSIFVIAGKEATVLVATADKTMTRLNALNVASSFIYGKYEEITIDLKRLIASVSKGQPKINHPPY